MCLHQLLGDLGHYLVVSVELHLVVTETHQVLAPWRVVSQSKINEKKKKKQEEEEEVVVAVVVVVVVLVLVVVEGFSGSIGLHR